jgi:hypothetical protein
LSNKQYDFLKKLAQLWLPAAGSLYFGLAVIWGLPFGEQVVGSLALLATFIGVILGKSSAKYLASDRPFDGDILTSTSEDGVVTYTLELGVDPYDIPKKDKITFRVKDSDADIS